MEYRWWPRRIQKDGGKRDDSLLVPPCSIIIASSIEKLSAIHMQRVIKLSYYICARFFNHSKSMEQNAMDCEIGPGRIMQLNGTSHSFAMAQDSQMMGAPTFYHYVCHSSPLECQILERGCSNFKFLLPKSSCKRLPLVQAM